MDWNSLGPDQQKSLAGILARNCNGIEIDRAIAESFQSNDSLSTLTRKYKDLAAAERYPQRLLDLVAHAVEYERLQSLVKAIQRIKLGSVTFRNLADLVDVNPDGLALVGGSAVSESGRPGFEFQSAASQLRAANQPRIILVEDLLKRIAEIKEATCRFVLVDEKEAPASNDQAEPLGTGILVGDDLILTNYHVLKDFIEMDGAGGFRPPPARLRCQFDYGRAENPGQLVPLAGGPDWLAGFSTIDAGALMAGQNPIQDGHWDYALVRLAKPAPRIDGQQREFEAPSDANAFTDGLPVLVVHHPGHDPLSAAFGMTVRTQADGNSLRYSTDVVGGASGSGVYLLPKCSLVSLHQGNNPAAGYNQGIPIGRILRDHLFKGGQS